MYSSDNNNKALVLRKPQLFNRSVNRNKNANNWQPQSVPRRNVTGYLSNARQMLTRPVA